MFRRNKLIAVGMGAFCLLALAVLPGRFTDWIRTALTHFYSPPLRFAAATGKTARSAQASLKSREQLSKENEQLFAELTRLRMETARLPEVTAENERLRRMLQFKGTMRLSLLAARVIGRDPSNWWKSIRIDRGAADGVAVNNPVITPSGVVGRVVAVSSSESQILLLVDRACKVSGVIQNSREPGIVMGEVAEMTAGPRCRMTFISRSAKVEPNSPVVTSGMGGVFPAGLTIGNVAPALRADSGGLYQDIDVIPAVDFKTLEEVFVILKQ